MEGSMTLETMQNVKKQLETQMQVLLTTPPEKPVIMHTNAIELHGALQLITQLMQQEEIAIKAPPGATGPAL